MVAVLTGKLGPVASHYQILCVVSLCFVTDFFYYWHLKFSWHFVVSSHGSVSEVRFLPWVMAKTWPHWLTH